MTMLICSMDHSPQEIPRDPNAWHTTTLLVSVTGEQWGWDKTLGPMLNPQGKKMRKWAGGRKGSYRDRFRQHFPSVLASSGVFGLAFSAQGGTVVDCLSDLVGQMGINQNLSISGQKATVTGLSSGQDFSISTDQAAYVLYLIHFICRMHALVLERLRSQGWSWEWCDWQISPDNFPFGVNGSMAKLFSILANSSASLSLLNGNLRVLTHQYDGDPGVDVCDNLVGMLREHLEGIHTCSLEWANRPEKGRMYWEIHTPKS